MTTNLILIVEDDADISHSVATFLHANGYTTVSMSSSEAANQWLKSHNPNLILLDLLLPGEGGLSFCHRIRSSVSSPIIMVTALADNIDSVVGLESGADDYIAKPFDLSVLLARIRAVLRRASTNEVQPVKTAGEPVLQFAGFTFYPFRRYLSSQDGIRKSLTGGETDLLLVFCQHVKQVLSREDLIELTRGSEDAASTRSVDLLISRLRRKLTIEDNSETLIRTFRNNGYMFRPEVRRT